MMNMISKMEDRDLNYKRGKNFTIDHDNSALTMKRLNAHIVNIKMKAIDVSDN